MKDIEPDFVIPLFRRSQVGRQLVIITEDGLVDEVEMRIQYSSQSQTHLRREASVAQLVRALASHARGPEFEPRRK